MDAAAEAEATGTTAGADGDAEKSGEAAAAWRQKGYRGLFGPWIKVTMAIYLQSRAAWKRFEVSIIIGYAIVFMVYQTSELFISYVPVLVSF
jgi:hypothetical protein